MSDRGMDGGRPAASVVGLYEEKVIVQHLLAGSTPRAVVYSPYGQPYRLE